MLLLDAGANSDARASHLVQFAHLGAAFAEAVLGVERPRVALLSIGEEAKKGNALVVDAHRVARRDDRRRPAIDFRGNVEGRDLLDRRRRRRRHRRLHRQRRAEDRRGHREGGRRGGPRRGAVRRASRGRRACSCGRRSASLRERLDPDTTGGAILLGLRGVAVVGHGSSGPRGIHNQIALAARAVRERAVERTAERSGALGGRARRAPGRAWERPPSRDRQPGMNEPTVGSRSEEIFAKVREHLATEREIDAGAITDETQVQRGPRRRLARSLRAGHGARGHLWRCDERGGGGGGS